MEEFEAALSEIIAKYGEFKIEEDGDSVIATGDLKAGTKGMSVRIECDGKRVKVKGVREYGYLIDPKACEDFQSTVIQVYPDCQCYVNGQTLTFSKFFSYEGVEESTGMIKLLLDNLSDIVSMFEGSCVRFNVGEDYIRQQEEDDYDPEKNVSLIDVDNTTRATTVTEADNEEYIGRSRNYAAETFERLCRDVGGESTGEFEFRAVKDGKNIFCSYDPDDTAIIISVYVNATKDVASMYQSYISHNFDGIMCGFDDKNEAFIMTVYSYPDEYSPDETQKVFDLCLKAMDAAMSDYKQILEKKDSVGFASDVQELLSDQTSVIAEREKAVSAREADVEAREAELTRQMEALEERTRELEDEKAALEQEMEEERARVQEHEKKMEEEMHDYEVRNTKDILRIQQLAAQISELQNRLEILSQGGTGSEEELFRQKSRVQQLISQKAALEKKLNEKISEREGKIRELGDVIAQKDAEIHRLETGIDDMVKSRTAEEAKKTEAEMNDLRKQVESIGHVLTASDLVKHYRMTDEITAKKYHAPDGGQFVVFDDESLEIRIRIGDLNYVDISKKATVKDSNLKKLNSANIDIKFFSNRDKTVARAYFPINASEDEVDGLIDEISKFFTK